jgi:phage gp16-like protein
MAAYPSIYDCFLKLGDPNKNHSKTLMIHQKTEQQLGVTGIHWTYQLIMIDIMIHH